MCGSYRKTTPSYRIINWKFLGIQPIVEDGTYNWKFAVYGE